MWRLGELSHIELIIFVDESLLERPRRHCSYLRDEVLFIVSLISNHLGFYLTINPGHHQTLKKRHNQADPTGKIIVEQLEYIYTTLKKMD